jgi:hypothetical protein
VEDVGWTKVKPEEEDDDEPPAQQQQPASMSTGSERHPDIYGNLTSAQRKAIHGESIILFVARWF